MSKVVWFEGEHGYKNNCGVCCCNCRVLDVSKCSNDCDNADIPCFGCSHLKRCSTVCDI